MLKSNAYYGACGPGTHLEYDFMGFEVCVPDVAIVEPTPPYVPPYIPPPTYTPPPYIPPAPVVCPPGSHLGYDPVDPFVEVCVPDVYVPPPPVAPPPPTLPPYELPPGVAPPPDWWDLPVPTPPPEEVCGPGYHLNPNYDPSGSMLDLIRGGPRCIPDEPLISIPTIPEIPTLPELPSLPGLPTLPDLGDIGNILKTAGIGVVGGVILALVGVTILKR